MIVARCFTSRAHLGRMFRAEGSCFYRPLQQKIRSVSNMSTEDTRRRAEDYRRTAGETAAERLLEPQTHNYYYNNNNYTTESAQQLDVALLVSVLRQENATDICVIRVPPELKYMDHMIIVSGSSPRHISAMAAFVLKVFKFLRKDEERHVRLEGRDCDDWKCIDFGSIVLHFMLPETRATYELEKLWTLRSYDEQLSRIPAETLPLDFIYDTKQEL